MIRALALGIVLFGCAVSSRADRSMPTDAPIVQLTQEQAEAIAKMALACVETEYPNSSLTCSRAMPTPSAHTSSTTRISRRRTGR